MGTLAGVISGGTVNFSLGSATFANKNVGTGTSLNGADAANYGISNPGSLNADIAAKALTVSASRINKVYDASTTASVALSDDRISGDVLTLSDSAASFAGKTVGTGKTVSVAGITVTRTDAGNYSFNTTASTTAGITAKALSLSGVSASNKVYDATTAAGISGGTLAGVISGGNPQRINPSIRGVAIYSTYVPQKIIGVKFLKLNLRLVDKLISYTPLKFKAEKYSN